MAWERRHGSCMLLYYRSYRDDCGRVKKVYLGCGPRAELAALAVVARRNGREIDRRALDGLRTLLRPADALAARLGEAAAVLTDAALLAEGYHRSNYGPWRRKRMTTTTTDGDTKTSNGGTNTSTSKIEAPDVGGQEAAQDALAEFKAVVARAKAGDASAVPQLRQLLDRHPDVWKRYGDLAAQAELAWVGLTAGQNLYLKECSARFAADRRAELTRPEATPAERLLVERAVSCWLQAEYFSAAEAHCLSKGDSPRRTQYHAKRQAQAQKQLQSALAALATVQKLLPVPSAAAKPAAEAVPAEATAAPKAPAPETPAGKPSPARKRSAATPIEYAAGHNRIEPFFDDVPDYRRHETPDVAACN